MGPALAPPGTERAGAGAGDENSAAGGRSIPGRDEREEGAAGLLTGQTRGAHLRLWEAASVQCDRSRGVRATVRSEP